MRSYEVTVAAEFDPGEPKFTPEPGKTYFYENAGTRGTRNVQTGETFSPEGMKVVVGDAETREVVAWYEIAPELRSSMHSTAVSPDGRYVYISGASPSAETEPQGASPGLSRAASSVLKVDALNVATGQAAFGRWANAPRAGVPGSLHVDRHVRPGPGCTDRLSVRPGDRPDHRRRSRGGPRRQCLHGVDRQRVHLHHHGARRLRVPGRTQAHVRRTDRGAHVLGGPAGSGDLGSPAGVPATPATAPTGSASITTAATCTCRPPATTS